MKAISLISVFLAFLLFPVLSIGQTCVDFQPLAIGTQFGTPTDMPEDVVYTQNNIPVLVDSFEFTGGGGTFFYCRVDTIPAAFGSNKAMWTNNINLKFDFSGLVFTPNHVVFEFADLGGFENIAVNGQPIFAGELTSAPVSIAPGVTYSIATNMIPAGKKGAVILRGPVTSLLVGGQEFYLNKVCARDTVMTGLNNLYSYGYDFSMAQNFPNPFSNGTEIGFYMPETRRVEIMVFTIEGRLVNTLANAEFDSGLHSVRWDGRDVSGNVVPGGMYFYYMKAGNYNAVRTMIMLR